MAHVFISYKHEDGDFVFDTLKPNLIDKGFDVWIDEERLRAGEDWRQEIDQAIEDAFAVIVVITPESMQSQYVIYEWSFALGMGKGVVPLLLKTTQQLHPRLIGRQHLDFTNRRNRPWDRLEARLQQISQALSAMPSQVMANASVNPNPIIAELKDQVLNYDDDEYNWRARLAAMKKLAVLKAIGVHELAQILLVDPYPGAREAAAMALGQLQDVDGVQYLNAALQGEDDREVRQAVLIALEQLGTPVALQIIENWRRTHPSDFPSEMKDVSDLPF